MSNNIYSPTLVLVLPYVVTLQLLLSTYVVFLRDMGSRDRMLCDYTSQHVNVQKQRSALALLEILPITENMRITILEYMHAW